MSLRLEIASPCSERWESMTGDDRKRFCAKCQLHVHDVRALSEVEVVSLLSNGTGRICGRVFRRADGTVLTKDCPVGVARLRRQAALVFVTVAAMVLAIMSVRPEPGSASSSSPFSGGGTWKGRLVNAKEYLRGTALFGPLIDRLDPVPPSSHILGKIKLRTPTTTSGS